MEMREFYTSSLFVSPDGKFTCKGETKEFSVAVASRFARLLPDFKCPVTCRDDDSEFIALCNEFSYLCLSLKFAEYVEGYVDKTQKWIVPADVLRAFGNFESWDDGVKSQLRDVFTSHKLTGGVFNVDNLLKEIRVSPGIKVMKPRLVLCITNLFIEDFMDTHPPSLLDSIRKTRLSMSTTFDVFESRHHSIQGLAHKLCKFVKKNLQANALAYNLSFANFLASDDFIVKMYCSHIREHEL